MMNKLPLPIEESSQYDPSKSRLVNASPKALPKLPPGAQYCTGRSAADNLNARLMMVYQTAKLLNTTE